MAYIVHAAADLAGQNHDRIQMATSRNITLAGSSVPTDSASVVDITAWQKMLSATSGSLLTGLLVTPLDVVRVRWQAQSASATSYSKTNVSSSSRNVFRPSKLGVTACCREVFFIKNTSEVCLAGPTMPGSSAKAAAPIACAVEQMQQRTFNSTLDGLRKIARNEGFTTLWRGLSPTLVMAIPGNIIYYAGYEWLRFNKASPIQQKVRDEYASLFAGAVARVLAATAIGPIEMFRTRLQASHGETARGHVADTFHGIQDMVRVNGYRSLWRGLTLTLWRDVPFSGMYWWGYETIRGGLTDMRDRSRGCSRTMELERGARWKARRQSQSRENHSETFTDSFVAGALSGALVSVATMPFDVGKTRMQVYRDGTKSGQSSTASSAVAAAKTVAAPEEQSMGRLLWHIFQAEGMAGLFRGWIPRMLKVAPACAIMISSYEVGKRAFRVMNERAFLRENASENDGGGDDDQQR